MRFPLLALLLIANLLACPLRCLSCEMNVAAGQECAPPACLCCSHDQQGQESPSPEPCGGDCECQDCICDGAVVETGVELPDSENQNGQWLLTSMASTSTAALLSAAFPRQTHAPAGQFLCGRTVRIAHQSWLI